MLVPILNIDGREGHTICILMPVRLILLVLVLSRVFLLANAHLLAGSSAVPGPHRHV